MDFLCTEAVEMKYNLKHADLLKTRVSKLPAMTIGTGNKLCGYLYNLNVI